MLKENVMPSRKKRLDPTIKSLIEEQVKIEVAKAMKKHDSKRKKKSL